MTILFEPSIARAARAYTGLTQELFGEAAGVAKRTVFKLEQDGRVEKRSLDRILSAFERLGVVMLYDEQGAANGMEFHPPRRRR
ncbi:transcriptional regulator [Rhizobium laguerreae]|uniref:transcriptional regulator n=1 Tax=Rhizobium laguerreae TaxID=1076926 RepID=UPI0010392350|nr:transcriptional regulator [Rhizobium laguerreae]TBY07315.1 transcriptional regulator [Rhizobium laguerreae]